MLSIANVSANMADSYYKKDGYYTRLENDSDTWQGTLKEALQLADVIAPSDFNEIIHERDKLAGFDLCFSAPKSVSVAMAISDKARQDMIDAHNAAVAFVLAQIEKREIGARVTKNGETEYIKTGNMLCAKFNHYVSRNSDPQLHTHAVICNKTEYNGKFYAVDNRNLYKSKILNGQLYRNELARELMEKGYSIQVTDPVKGFFELQGIAQATLDKFSTRRSEILEKMRQKNVEGAEAAARATILTRRAKEHKDIAVLIESWRATLEEQCGEICLNKADSPVAFSVEQQQTEFNEAVQRIEGRSFAFTAAVVKRAVMAAGVASGMAEDEYNALLLTEGEKRLTILGNLSTKENDEVYYTTPRNLQTEKHIFHEVARSKKNMIGMPVEDIQQVLDQVLARDKAELSEQQRAAVIYIASSRDQYVAVQGLAGVGKTYMLNYAREVFESAGYEVVGAAFTGKAAQGLEEDGKISASTIHALLNRLERTAGNFRPGEDMQLKKEWDLSGLQPSGKKQAWFIDEASLVDNETMKYLMIAAKAQNAKMILVGDHRQLQPIGVGNAYEVLIQTRKIGTVILDEIRRQKNRELLQAVREAVAGDVNKSLYILEKDTQIIEKHVARIKGITNDFVDLTADERKKTIILTASNKDRIAINNAVRAKLLKSGEIETGMLFTAQDASGRTYKREFSPQDKIIFLQNDHKLSVRNGQTGFITQIDGSNITVNTGGKERIINMNKYNKIDYGYAMTAYKAQGVTADRVLINLDSTQRQMNSRNAFYVDISRARYEVRLYTDDVTKINEQIRIFSKKITSDDFGLKAEKYNQSISGVKNFKTQSLVVDKIGAVNKKIAVIEKEDIKANESKFQVRL